MNSPVKSTDSKALPAISKALPGPPYLRYYPDNRLVAWQPQGTLDDLILDQIAEWLVDIEKASLPFKRFVDFSQLTTIAVRTRHVLNLRERERSNSPESSPCELRYFVTTGSALASRVYTSR